MKTYDDIAQEAADEALRLFPDDTPEDKLLRCGFAAGYALGYRQHDIDGLRDMLDAGNKALAGAGVV